MEPVLLDGTKMSDDEYAKKLHSMQQYIPFLEVMIKQLKDPKKKNREQQLQKMESLYAMITDTKRKLKYETLVKCEDVIKKIQEKVNPSSSAMKMAPGMQKFVCKDPPEKSMVNIDKMRDEKFRLELARSKLQDLTPASPSPPREIPPGNPIIVPTERVERRERPNIYTAAGANLLAKDTERKLQLERTPKTLPEMSKPPLSQEDLKMLENPDATETDVSEKSLDELESIRQKLYRELGETKDSPTTPKQKETTETTTKTTPTKKPPKVEKVIKEPDSIFGSILSSLDGKIIDLTKKDKKPAKKEHKSDKDAKEQKKGDSKDSKERTHDSKETKHKDDKHKTSKDKQKSKESTEAKPDVGADSKKEPAGDGSQKKSGDGNSSVVVYKRLADKYNPKPRKHSIEEDVEKQIEEQIQNAKLPSMELSPSPQLSPTNTCLKRFQPSEPSETVVENRPSWFEPPSRVQESNELVKMHNPIPVINQLCSPNAQIRINTNINPVGNMTPIDPFLSSPTGFISPTNIFPNQMLPIQQNQMVPNQMIQQNQRIQQNQIVQQNQMVQQSQLLSNQPFVPPQNQFLTRNQMMAHSTNIGGNTFVNNFIMQQPTGSFFQQQQQQQKKSFNPYEPIGEPSQLSEGIEQSQRFDRNNSRINYNQNRANFSRPRIQNRFGDTDERPYHNERDPRRQPRDNRDPRLASVRRSLEESTKFDVTYSKLDQKDTFTSPLDSLYNNTGREVQGKGYGVQKFKIPKIKKPERDNVKETNKGDAPKTEIAVTCSNKAEEHVNTKSEEEIENQKKQEVPKVEENVSNKKGEEKKTEEKEEAKATNEEEKSKESKEDKKDAAKEEPEKKLATEEDLIKELVKGIIDRAPDQKEVLYSIINTLTGKKKKKKYKKIRPVIESESESSSSDSDSKNSSSSSSSDKEDEAKETKPKSKKTTKGTSPNNKEEGVSKKSKSKTKVVEKSKDTTVNEPKDTTGDVGEESTPPSTRLRSKRLSAKKSEETEEPLQESVGERIKNRKRHQTQAQQQTTTPKAPARRHKTELDLLHEDIKEMFIRDGVLTATGKRMCRILKDNPNALNETQKPQTGDRRESFEEDDNLPLVSRLRRSHNKGDTVEGTESPKTQAAKTNLCVLIEKSISIEELSKKALELELKSRRSIDDESTDGDDNKDDKSKKLLDTSTETDCKSETADTTATETDTTFDSDATKSSPKVAKKKKPKSSWYTGFIKKKKKKVRALSETTSAASSPIPHDDTSSVTSEVESTIESTPEIPKIPKQDLHQKDYYWKSDRMDCKLCQFKGKILVLHYRSVHPESEVLISRLKPEVCEEALKNAETPFDLDPTENPRHRYTYDCLFCGAVFKNIIAETFHDHLASHTGEYRYYCSFCRFQSPSGKSLRTHLSMVHNTSAVNNGSILEPSHGLPHGRRYVYGHMCGECYFVQMRREAVEDHIKNHHDNGDDIKIIKINLSRTLPELPQNAKKKEPDSSGDKNETSTKDSELDESGVIAIDSVDDENTRKQTKEAAETHDENAQKEAVVISDKPLRKKPGPKPKKKSVVLKKTTPKKSAQEKLETTSSDAANENEEAPPGDGPSTSKSPTIADDVPQNDDELMEEEEKKITSTVTSDNTTDDASGVSISDGSSGGVEKIAPISSGLNKSDDKNTNNATITDEKTPVDGVTKETVTTNHKTADTQETTKETDLSVFTTHTDLNDDNQQIEKERMEKMQAIYKGIKRHQSSFIEKLKTKLDNQKNAPKTPQTPTLPPQESEITSTVPELCKKAAIRVINFDEITPSSSGVDNLHNRDDVQNQKKMVPIMGTIERLQEQLTAAPKLSPFAESNSLMPPPMTPVKDFELETAVNLIQSGPIVVRKVNHTTEYLCFAPGCTFVSYTELAFESHVRQSHGDGADYDGKCTLCLKMIGDARSSSGLSELFAHVVSEHLNDIDNKDCKGFFDDDDDTDSFGEDHKGGILKKNDDDSTADVKVDTKDVKTGLLLRTRRMSGDILSSDIKKSIKQEVVDDVDEVRTQSDNSKEDLITPSEDSFFPFAIKSVETENEYTMPVISNVVSLAEDNDGSPQNEQQQQLTTPPPLRPLGNSQFIRLEAPGGQINLMITPDSPSKSNLLILNQLPVSPQVNRNVQQQTSPSPTKKVLLKEFPMTADDFKKPKKSQEAMIAMCMHSNLVNLYKCPVFECIFTTNGRFAFENHLTSRHLEERNQLMPCVYCNFKTEYSHIVIHHDVRHGSCLYACCYCVYRGICQGYVEVHQNEMHHNQPKRVLLLPIHKDSMSSKGRMAKPRLKDLIVPYRCAQKSCSRVYLTTADFFRHLKTHFVAEYSCSICSYKSPTVEDLLKHQSQMHGMCYYNCAYCKMGANSTSSVFRHQALHHFCNSPDVVLRSFKKRRVVDGSVVLDQEYEDLCHSHADMKQASFLVPVSKLLPKQKPTSTATTNVEVTKINLLGTEPPLSIDELIRETLSDEPLLDIIQKDAPAESSTPQEEDPLRLDVDSGNVTPKTADKTTPQIIVPNNFAFLDESDSQDVDPDLERNNDEPEEPGAKVLLSGHDLYKCKACGITFPSSAVFRNHLNKCSLVTVVFAGTRPYHCPHCDKTFKNANTLTEHIRIHGIGKFKCSLCDFEHCHLYQVRAHMKARHKIANTVVTPLEQNKTDADKDNFVVRPRIFKRKSVDGNSSYVKEPPDETKADLTKISKLNYGPGEIDQLPRQPIYHCQVTCSVCGYATKVRTNLVRHLEFHLKEKEVPSTAPVNPVPCLEKNEKMFDKMTNLAISSMGSGGRMGGKTEGDRVALTKEEEALLPAFVPSTKRFVCGITSCNYLCHEESRLRHHLMALHMDETTYTCTHCKEVLRWEKGNVNIDHVMKHMRLHDLNLYKCSYCSFHHNLKHKVERHVADKHLDKKLQVITVREMSADSDSAAVSTEKDLVTLAKEAKVWKCGMCKYRTATQDDMKTHCVHKHDIDSQYKCALCTYKSNNKVTFKGHFEEEHKGNGVDIIDVFYNTSETSTKNEADADPFDTTPLWQRDRPRVRHIRGILLDDGRKTKKSFTKTAAETTEAPNFAEETVKPRASKTSMKATSRETPSDLLSELNSAIREITEAIVVDDDEDDFRPKKKRKVSIKKDVAKVKNEEPPERNAMGTYGPYGAPLNNMFLCPLCNKFNTRFESDITNHLYQELEYFRYKCGLCDTTGITFTFLCEHSKKKHSQSDPKNIMGLPKNEQIEQWVAEVLKVQREQIDESSSSSSSSSTKVDIKKESQTFVEYETVVLSIDDDDDDDELIVDDVTTIEEEPVVSTSVEVSATVSPELKKLQSCPHCPYQCKTVSDLRKHEKRHWAVKPFKCAHCTTEGITIRDVQQHSMRAHPTLPPDVIEQEMPEIPEIIPLGRKRKAKDVTEETATVATPPPKKIAAETEVSATATDMIFICKYCPKRSETVEDLRIHWERVHGKYVFQYKTRKRPPSDKNKKKNKDKDKDKDVELPTKCIFCTFYGNVEDLKRHYDTVHADSKKYLHYKCSECDEYFFRLDMLKGHFYEKHSEKPFLVANCKNKNWKFEKRSAGQATASEEPKKFKCGNSGCGHTSNSYNAMKAHLRSHAKPYKCAYCDMCCNYPSFILKHQQFSHPGLEFKYDTIDESFKINEMLRRTLLVLNEDGEYEVMGVEKRKRAKPKLGVGVGDTVDDLLVVKKVVYTARKKTTPVNKPKATARKSTTFIPVQEEGFSYYGQKPEELDLKKLTTKISIGGNDLVTTIEQFSHISNLFPKLYVEDCCQRPPEET